jgi:hypothetical protein
MTFQPGAFKDGGVRLRTSPAGIRLKRDAADRGREPTEEGRGADTSQGVKNDVMNACRVEATRHDDRSPDRQQIGSLALTNGSDEASADDFEGGVATRHERVGSVQQVLGSPRLGRPARQPELLGDSRRRKGDPGVDAPNERAGNRFRVRSVARPFRGEIASVLHPARHRVALDEIRSEHFRQPPLHRSAPEVHL